MINQLIIFDSIMDSLNLAEPLPPAHVSLMSAFSMSFLTILVSEIGDKTFFLAALLAMKYDKLIVFIGSYGALAIMTILSCALGNLSTTIVSKALVDLLAALFFLGIGIKLLW